MVRTARAHERGRPVVWRRQRPADQLTASTSGPHLTASTRGPSLTASSTTGG
jgi:hypothetical protein